MRARQTPSFQDKAAKDRHQATVLVAALAEANPQALIETYRSMPAAMRVHVDKVVSRVDFGVAAGLVEEVIAHGRNAEGEPESAPSPH